ncbi:unnamed protein product [Protopolystoma xenopodis]|uniref:Uncharacterized protein n=1 Tax=Protopolystoma xenopodis TaxID=117903 RepID=A0A448X0D3_9PLAT|nr:unnamed protein product [Protopolystoma xenopodis]
MRYAYFKKISASKTTGILRNTQLTKKVGEAETLNRIQRPVGEGGGGGSNNILTSIKPVDIVPAASKLPDVALRAAGEPGSSNAENRAIEDEATTAAHTEANRKFSEPTNLVHAGLNHGQMPVSVKEEELCAGFMGRHRNPLRQRNPGTASIYFINKFLKYFIPDFTLSRKFFSVHPYLNNC